MLVSATHEPILQPGRTCWVVAAAADSGLLIDGEEYFRAFRAAARQARHYILLAGWQFDSDVSLVRGEDAKAEDARLLPLLRALCAARPELQVRLLCWDYSPAFFFQREWLQDLVFNSAGDGRIVFRFDDRHPIGGSHHQKFAVIDDAVAFVGSMDLCNERWDERAHAVHCAGRDDPVGYDTYGPYHEVQGYVTGPAVADLRELFAARWRSAGAGALELPAPPGASISVRPTIRLGPARVGLSRTLPRTLVPDQFEIREIEQLCVDAIAAAERVLYIESQYFGARALLAAFLRRLRQSHRPRLQVVLVCPRSLHSMSERVAIAGPQNIMFDRLRRLAAANGHGVGIYHVVATADDGEERDVYIHSKLMVVDDRFLTVGSANMNNRSMGLDSELNLSWEAGPDDAALRRAIRRVRVSLLVEHSGVRRYRDVRALYRGDDLVAQLDRLAAGPRARLRPHPPEEVPPASAHDLPEESGLDIDRPLEATMFERIFPGKRDVLGAGLRRVRRSFRKWRSRRSVAVDPPLLVARRPNLWWTGTVRTVRRLAVPLLVLAVLGAVIWGVVALVGRLL